MEERNNGTLHCSFLIHVTSAGSRMVSKSPGLGLNDLEKNKERGNDTGWKWPTGIPV